MVPGDARGDADAGRWRGRALAPVALVVLATLGMAVGAVGPAAGQTDTVTLTVSVETPDGEPVSNATVEASWDGGSDRKTTAGNGKVFMDVPSGETVTFTVGHPDYVRNRPFRATRSSDGDVSITVAPRASLTVVATTDDGDAVRDAAVTVSRLGRTVAEGRTDGNGRYATGDIEAREYDVTVAKPGYFTRQLTVDLGGAETRRITLEAGTVEYTFRVRDGHFDPPRPVENATVEVGSVGSVRTLAGGRASIGVPVNTVQQVRVTKPGYETVTREVRVGESRGNVTVTTRRSANVSLSAGNRQVVVGERVTVTVRNAYGEPIEGATVLLDGSSVGTTDASGQLSVPIEERGAHELRARRNALTSPPVTVEGVVPAGTETATPARTPTPTEEGPLGIARGVAPGFGPGAAIAALALAAGWAVARRRR
ncbi:MAG: carboxypeptidase regulatory-like domain-containing protein [Haloferacaceae archaeon]